MDQDKVHELCSELENAKFELEQEREKVQRIERDLEHSQAIAHIGSWRLNFSNGLFQCSEPCREILGFTEKETLTKEKFLALIHPNDLHRLVEKQQECISNGTDFEIEHRIIVKHHVKWVSNKAELEYDSNSQLIGFSGTIEDITQQKKEERKLEESEKKYQELFRNINEGYLLVRVIFGKGNTITDFIIEETNDTFATWVGQPIENLVGYSTLDLNPDLRNEMDFWTINVIKILQTKKPLHLDYYFEPIQRWFTLSMYAPNTCHVAIIFEDINERRNIEERLKEEQELGRRLSTKLRQTTEDLTKLNDDFETFNDTVSHDLQDPLWTIKGFSEALQEDYAYLLDDTGKDYLNRILEGIFKMEIQIGALLLLSRQTRGELNKVSFNLAPLVEKIKDDLEGTEPLRNCTWVIHPLCEIFGDKDLLTIAMYNLLENAWKSTKSRSPGLIEVGCMRLHDTMEVFVKDNGVGFDMKDVDRLFIPFQRLQNQTVFPGIGIGLTTVKRIIQKHHGHTWAEGKPGEGATFFYTLPLKE